MNLLMDPTRFGVEQLKQMGMWPPGDIAGLGLLPYIKRIKANDLKFLEVGVGKGENASYILENTQPDVRGNCKISTYYGMYANSESETEKEFDDVLQNNMKAPWFDRFRLGFTWDDKDKFDIVCVNSHCENLDFQLNLNYNYLKSGGIYCGNDHALVHVKEALNKFRRDKKIGELIHVSRGSWFWYKR